ANLPCSLALRTPVRCKRSTIQKPGTSRRRRPRKQTLNSKSCPEGTVQLPTFFNDRGVGDRVDVSTHGKAWKLCRPYRTESFISVLIPGAAPDGLPQAIKLSCAFSADLVSRTPRWERRASSPARCSCGKHEEQKESYVRPLVRQHCRSLTKSGIPPTTRKSALQPRATNPSALQARYKPKAWDEPKATSQETDVKLKILS